MFVTQSLKNLLDKLFFACVLLLGIQLPNFVIQYQQSVDAHYNESSKQLQQYQDIADRFYAGDISQLLTAHQRNAVAAIRAESEVLVGLIQRSDYLRQELDALQNKQLLEQLLHLLNHFDFEIADEVLNSYSISLPLDLEAIAVGLTLAFACNIAAHVVLAILLHWIYPKPRDKPIYRP